MRGPWGAAEGLPGTRVGEGHRDSEGPWGFQEGRPPEPGTRWSLGVSGAAAEVGPVWASPDGQPGPCGPGLREGARRGHAARAAPLPGMQIWVDRRGAGLWGQVGKKQRIRAGQLALSTGLPPVPCSPSPPVRGLLPSTGEEGTEITGQFSVQTSRNSTRLPQHSGEWGPAGNRARGGRPSPGVALLRARVDTHVPARRGAWDRPEPAPAAGAAHVESHREPTAERSPRGTAFGPEGYISLPKIPSNALGGSAPGERGPAWGSSLGPAG